MRGSGVVGDKHGEPGDDGAERWEGRATGEAAVGDGATRGNSLDDGPFLYTAQ